MLPSCDAQYSLITFDVVGDTNSYYNVGVVTKILRRRSTGTAIRKVAADYIQPVIKTLANDKSSTRVVNTVDVRA